MAGKKRRRVALHNPPQPIEAAMPPPSGPGANATDASHFGGASGGNAGADQSDDTTNVNGMSVGDGGADGSGGEAVHRAVPTTLACSASAAR